MLGENNMHFEYKTKGTCSTRILFDVEDGRLRNLEFVNGCDGNLQGLGRLTEGMDVDVVIEKLSGIRCGGKPTSCPDQLAKALAKAKEKLAAEPAQ